MPQFLMSRITPPWLRMSLPAVRTSLCFLYVSTSSLFEESRGEVVSVRGSSRWKVWSRGMTVVVVAAVAVVDGEISGRIAGRS